MGHPPPPFGLGAGLLGGPPPGHHHHPPPPPGPGLGLIGAAPSAAGNLLLGQPLGLRPPFDSPGLRLPLFNTPPRFALPQHNNGLNNGADGLISNVIMEQPQEVEQQQQVPKPKERRERASRWNREDEDKDSNQNPPPAIIQDQQQEGGGGINLADRLRSLAGCGDNNGDNGPPPPGQPPIFEQPWNNGKSTLPKPIERENILD